LDCWLIYNLNPTFQNLIKYSAVHRLYLFPKLTRKTVLDRGSKSDRPRYRITTPALTSTVTYDIDLQSQASCGHDPHIHTNSSSKVSRFKRQSENKRTDRQTDATDCFTFPANAVGKNLPVTFCCLHMPTYRQKNVNENSTIAKDGRGNKTQLPLPQRLADRYCLDTCTMPSVSPYLLSRLHSWWTLRDRTPRRQCIRPVPSQTSTSVLVINNKVKASHTRYRALGLELIPVYRQSARRWLKSSTRR